jgi:hypothetical protein
MKAFRIAMVLSLTWGAFACGGSSDKPNNDLGTADLSAPQGMARVKFSMKGVK